MGRSENWSPNRPTVMFEYIRSRARRLLGRFALQEPAILYSDSMGKFTELANSTALQPDTTGQVPPIVGEMLDSYVGRTCQQSAIEHTIVVEL